MLTVSCLQQSIRSLRTTIKGRALTSRQMRIRANQLTGIPKHEMHSKMRRYGATTRYYLLAYAMIRGRVYLDVERCRPNNLPWIGSILETLELEVGDYWGHEDVRNWLKARPVMVKAHQGVAQEVVNQAAA